jgi:hypothetical protein
MKKIMLFSLGSLFVLATLLSSCCSTCEKECDRTAAGQAK